MSMWQVLGISPTADVAAIKRAYAEKSRRFHPEEHPDEFRALHDAYRQATRYARQHPQPSAPTAPPVPAHAEPPQATGFKPSYLPRDPEDNPRRAHLHRLADNVLNAEQFRAMREECKRIYDAAPVSTPPTLPRQLEHLRIRGAAQAGTPAGGLNFDAARDDLPDAEQAAAAPPVTIASLPLSPPAKKRSPRAMAWAVLLLWLVYLFTFGLFAPAPVTAALYLALLSHHFSKRAGQNSWPFTLAASLVDVVSTAVLMVLAEDCSAAVAAAANDILGLAMLVLPLLRIGLLMRTSRLIRKS